METGQKRVNILGVQVDNLKPEELEERIRELIDQGKGHQIIFLSLPDLLRARGSSRFAETVSQASLVIPTTKGISRGASFLKKEVPHRYMPFEFVIRVMGILEKLQKSVYLLGSKPRYLQISSANIRASFPGLNNVGRCSGFYTREMEENILLAIKKAAPSLLLVGDGIKGKDRWIYEHKSQLAPGLYLWSTSCFKIFSGRKQKPPRETWEKGLDWLPKLVVRPWRIFMIFAYLYYAVLLLIYRIRGS